MSELCHICDLFRTALFGPTNTEEDHLGDQGNDLPRPMPDAPATLRSRNRSGASSGVAIAKSHDPSARSGERAAGNDRASTSGTTAPSTAGAPPGSEDEESPETGSAGGGGGLGSGLGNNGNRKSIPKKFTQRPQRGLKASPAYMSFDDVDVEDDDSDGELFSEATAAQARNGASAALNASTPSVYRAPVLENEAGHRRDGPGPGRGGAGGDPPGMPPPPEYSSNAAMTQGAKYAPGHGGDVEHMGPHANGRRGAGLMAEGAARMPAGMGTDERHSGYGLPIPQDGSGVEGARPHAQSITESYHGYKGYPGYEPETPVAGDLAPQGRTGSSESLMARPQHDVPDRRDQAETTPSNMRRNPRVGFVGGSSMRNVKKHTGSMESDVGEPHPHPHHSHQSHHQPLSISPSGTMDHMTSLGGDSQLASGNQHLVPGTYGSRSGSANYRPSPANSIASSFRRDDGTRSIPAMPSEDGMGSVLGTIGDPEDATNEDLQWKRSALKKFHKVMVKGDGLRVVKHNRSGGSQMRIIRYNPDIKALVWNSKRYMKKAGSANVPIVDIKRVGREGSTVSITAAGRGTIGFEPQRIRDAKILEEALRALVDKEERSAMWRG